MTKLSSLKSALSHPNTVPLLVVRVILRFFESTLIKISFVMIFFQVFLLFHLVHIK
jgi:hypothetical protein